MYKSKKEIFDLLNQFHFPELFQELDSFFKKNNDSYNALISEYVHPPGTFVPSEFAKRLRVFINRNYEPGGTTKGTDKVDFYDALCNLDFKIQTEHFKRIYKYKKVAAFLLHSNIKDGGSDIRWLCNQLLYKESLLDYDPLIIDLNSSAGCSLDRLFEEFFAAFEVTTSVGSPEDHLLDLRGSLENRLMGGPYVCIVQGPQQLLANEVELDNLFKKFFSFMNRVRQKDHKNPIIFLLAENRIIDYNLQRDKFFIWYDKSRRENYASNAVYCTDFKIIDLGPVEKLEVKDIKSWIDWSLTVTGLFEKLSSIRGKEEAILQKGKEPYKVIESICSELQIPIESKWIK
jgi:hypothetical protein